MSDKLVYKKIFIDSNYRTVQSRSSADFSIELNENIEAPEGTKCWITDVSIPAVWKTTEVGYEYLYVMVFDGDTLIKNFRHYLGNTIYFAEQLCFYMAEGMNNNTTDLSAGGIFVYAYNSATRIVEFKIKDGLTYTIKNPTDAELQNYAGGVWDTGHSNYDTRNIVSINYLLSNFVPKNPIGTWTSSYLNLVPFRVVYISSSSLLDYHYSEPNSYSSSIACEEEEPLEIANDVVEENANEEPTPKPEPKAKARPKQLSQSESSYGHRPKPNDLVLRYSHKCSTEPPPVKKQANPKPTAKQTAKPKPKQVPKPLVMIMTAKIMHHNNH